MSVEMSATDVLRDYWGWDIPVDPFVIAKRAGIALKVASTEECRGRFAAALEIAMHFNKRNKAGQIRFAVALLTPAAAVHYCVVNEKMKFQQLCEEFKVSGALMERRLETLDMI